MENAIDLLLKYSLRSLPALVIGLLFILTAGRKQFVLRLLSYILLFILLRDVMTPLKVWRFGSEGLFWLRMVEEPVFMLLLSAMCIGIILLVLKLDHDAQQVYVLRKGSILSVIGTGLLGAAAVTVPMMIVYQFVPIAERGGNVSRDALLLGSLALFCLCVNFLEESVYRGFFQGYLEGPFSPLRAGILSGILFGFSHTFLALSVSDAGWGLIAFTTFEGIVAGIVRSRAGVLASTITHGLAIFALCSGLV